jgi:hypothetical protein
MAERDWDRLYAALTWIDTETTPRWDGKGGAREQIRAAWANADQEYQADELTERMAPQLEAQRLEQGWQERNAEVEHHSALTAQASRQAAQYRQSVVELAHRGDPAAQQELVRLSYADQAAAQGRQSVLSDMSGDVTRAIDALPLDATAKQRLHSQPSISAAWQATFDAGAQAAKTPPTTTKRPRDMHEAHAAALRELGNA